MTAEMMAVKWGLGYLVMYSQTVFRPDFIIAGILIIGVIGLALDQGLTNPKLTLMEEPFGALDAQTRSMMQEELLRVWQAHPRTVILITHSIDDAVYLADRIVVMTPRPGCIRSVVPVGLPRPRDPTSHAFGEYVR